MVIDDSRPPPDVRVYNEGAVTRTVTVDGQPLWTAEHMMPGSEFLNVHIGRKLYGDEIVEIRVLRKVWREAAK